MAGAHVIDIDQLVISLTSERNFWSRGKTVEYEIKGPVIFRIKLDFLAKHKNAYEPTILSIGPYYHGISSLQAMQITKYEFLDYILKLDHEKNLLDYLTAMKDLEKEVKCCYADEINMGRIHFLKLLLLDGCFLLVTLHGLEGSMLRQDADQEGTSYISNSESTQDDENLQTNRSAAVHKEDQEVADPIDQLRSQNLWHDLLLLGNQIPFFVLIKIHELAVGGTSTFSILIENIVKLVEDVLCCYPKPYSESNRPKEFHHLLHLCPMYFRPNLPEIVSYEGKVEPEGFHNVLQFKQNSILEGLNATQQASSWHQATEYHAAGIEFKKREYYSDNPHSLLDIVFCNGIIEIPCLTIDPNTETLFCNLLALEHSCPELGSYFTAYIKFMSSLINMPADVTLLTKRGIIVHQLNSDDEVSDLFKMISECAVDNLNSNSYLRSLSHILEAHYESRRPILRQFFGSVTSKIQAWAWNSESTDLPPTVSEETSVRPIIQELTLM